MKTRLFNHVLAVLQEHVDGDNADRFYFDARNYRLGEMTLDNARTENDQIRVMASYWFAQLSLTDHGVPGYVIHMLQHRKAGDFMSGFQDHIVPLIRKYDLPYVGEIQRRVGVTHYDQS